MLHSIFLVHPALVLFIALCQVVGRDQEVRPEEIDLALQEALRDFRVSRYDRVIHTLEKSLSDHPDHAGSHHLLDLAYAKRGNEEIALHHLERSLSLIPGHPTFSVNLARMYLVQRKPNKARETLNDALEIAPSKPIYYMLGFVFLDEHKGADAFTSFEKAMELDPQDGRSWYYMGLTHHAYGHFDDAISCYKKALDLNPNDFYANFQLGKVYAMRRVWGKR